MADEDKKIAEVLRKIAREKALINAATHMRQSTENTTVQDRVDSNIRESRKNIIYLEDMLRKLQIQAAGGSENGGPPPPPSHGGYAQMGRGQSGRGNDMNAGPPLPPKPYGHPAGRGDGGGYGDPGPGYSATGQMPPRAPYNDPRSYAPKRPNYSKLGVHGCWLLLGAPR
jgi:classical protein kinase C